MCSPPSANPRVGAHTRLPWLRSDGPPRHPPHSVARRAVYRRLVPHPAPTALACAAPARVVTWGPSTRDAKVACNPHSVASCACARVPNAARCKSLIPAFGTARPALASPTPPALGCRRPSARALPVPPGSSPRPSPLESAPPRARRSSGTDVSSKPPDAPVPAAARPALPPRTRRVQPRAAPLQSGTLSAPSAQGTRDARRLSSALARESPRLGGGLPRERGAKRWGCAARAFPAGAEIPTTRRQVRGGARTSPGAHALSRAQWDGAGAEMPPARGRHGEREGRTWPLHPPTCAPDSPSACSSPHAAPANARSAPRTRLSVGRRVPAERCETAMCECADRAELVDNGRERATRIYLVSSTSIYRPVYIRVLRTATIKLHSVLRTRPPDTHGSGTHLNCGIRVNGFLSFSCWRPADRRGT